MIDVLCDQQIFSLLVANLERFDEKNKDEAEAVHNSLAIVENIIEIKPFLSLDSTKQTFFQWLLKRINIKGKETKADNFKFRRDCKAKFFINNFKVNSITTSCMRLSCFPFLSRIRTTIASF